jgi:uncharacterized protein (DUF2062 family)
MWFRNYQKKFKRLFQQGLSPKELALSITVAIWVGIFPIYGTTTAILTLLAIRLKLNLPITMAISYVLTPIQIIGIIFFLRTGEFVLGLESLEIDIQSLKDLFNTGIIFSIQALSGSLLTAIVGWIIFAIPVSFFLYILLFQVFRKVKLLKLSKESS